MVGSGLLDKSHAVTHAGRWRLQLVQAIGRRLRISSTRFGSAPTCSPRSGRLGRSRRDRSRTRSRGTGGSSAPVAVAGGLSFTVLSGSGGNHTCALTAAGAAHCWGSNSAGQLGNGGTAVSNVPVAVSGGRSFLTITTGVSHSCGLTSSGAAFCWGANSSGQLGNIDVSRLFGRDFAGIVYHEPVANTAS